MSDSRKLLDSYDMFVMIAYLAFTDQIVASASSRRRIYTTLLLSQLMVTALK